jgi:hypothetical protein
MPSKPDPPAAMPVVNLPGATGGGETGASFSRDRRVRAPLYPTWNAGAVASGRLSSSFALEVELAGEGAANPDGISRADPADEPSECVWDGPRIYGELLKLGF